MFNPSTGSTLACIQGPKVDISKAGNPQLVFWYYAYPGTDGKITIKVNRNGQEMKEVGTVDYSKLSGSMGWRSVSFDLAGVSNAGVENGYIRPYFYAEGLSTSLLIDNIKIYDAVDNNLSAELDAPAHVQNGKVTVVNVKVTSGLAADYMQMFADIFAPHSGEQSMMSTGTTIDTGTPTNNWLITPELSGEEQTVSFWVNAPGDEVSRGEQNPNSGPETFDLYYSEDDTNPNSFIKINKDSYEAVYDWKQYNIDLPEGAKYFAIVHTSTGSLTSYNYEPDRVCVDDVK